MELTSHIGDTVVPAHTKSAPGIQSAQSRALNTTIQGTRHHNPKSVAQLTRQECVKAVEVAESPEGTQEVCRELAHQILWPARAKSARDTEPCARIAGDVS